MIVFAVVRPGEYKFRSRSFFLLFISYRDLNARRPLRLYPNRMSSNDPAGSRAENTPTTRMVHRYDETVEKIGISSFYVVDEYVTPTYSKTKLTKLERVERLFFGFQR